jgi:hypothetical protein
MTSGSNPNPSGGIIPEASNADHAPTVRDVEYKGGPLDAAKGPGLGCFWLQLGLLIVLVILTPIGVNAGWPELVTGGLLIATIVLLLFSGQTIIFLLRLVAADRRAEARRRPLQPRTPTVGQIEDENARGPNGGNEPPAVPE